MSAPVVGAGGSRVPSGARPPQTNSAKPMKKADITTNDLLGEN